MTTTHQTVTPNALERIKPKSFVEDNDDYVTTEQSTDYLFKTYFVLGMEMPKYNKFYKKVLYGFYSLLVNGMVAFYFPMAFSVSYALIPKGELQISALLTSLQACIDIWGCTAKVIGTALMVKQLRNCNEVTKKMDARCKDPDEINELKKLRATGRLYIRVFLISYWIYSSSTTVASLVQGRPPYSVYLPYINWRKSRWELYTASVIEWLLMDCTCVQETAVDSFGLIYVRIMRTHLKLLKMRVKKLGSQKNWTADQHLDNLKALIKDHKNYIELFETVAPVVSVTLFIQFVITAAVIGIALINFFIFAEFSNKVASASYIYAVLLETAPLCYQAQCLFEENKELCDEIFHSEWINRDARFRKMLIFFIQRSQRRMELTAGKIFIINLNTSISIAKFSFSLYTLIKGMNFKERYNL